MCFMSLGRYILLRSKVRQTETECYVVDDVVPIQMFVQFQDMKGRGIQDWIDRVFYVLRVTEHNVD